MTSSSAPGTRPLGWKARLALAAVGFVVAFAGCELMARLVYPTPPLPGREPQLVFQARADVGFLHLPNQQGYLDDGLATINGLGLRGSMPRVPKPEGAVRVLAVGDSTTFGWGVGDDEAYPVQLEALLRDAFPGRRIDVVNGGVSAYDLEHTYRFLKRFGPELQPDLVLVGLYWNDLPYEQIHPDDRGPFHVVDASLPGEAASEGEAAKGGGTFRLANAPSGLNRLLRSSRALYAVRHAWLAWQAPSDTANRLMQWEMALLEGRQTPAIDAAWDDIRRTMTAIRALSDAQGFDLGVVVVPIRAQVEQDYPQAAYQSQVRPMAESIGMFVVDPLPEFRAQASPSRLFIPFDRIHFTAEGNGVLAQAVFDALRDRRAFTESHQ